MKLFLMLGSILMALAVAIGAFGAHGLSGKVTEKMLANWQTGALYHIVHALAIIIIGLTIAKFGNSGLLTTAGWLIIVGILFFSGSLYVMVLTNVKVLGAITPIGGVAFIAGWICYAVAVSKLIP
jgi:uncharacterized membrane protein YgdD (TMEM256/DUF423 family)